MRKESHGAEFTKEVEEEAVRLVCTNGRTKREIADDLGAGVSTLTRWRAHGRDRQMEAPKRPSPGEDVGGELKRLRWENEVLRQERNRRRVKPHPEEGDGVFLQGGKSMRFGLVDAARKEFPVQRLCRCSASARAATSPGETVRPVGGSGRTWCCSLTSGPPSGAPTQPTAARATHELHGQGLQVGRRRTAKLMRDNGLRARQKRRFKRTTDSEHAWPIAPNLIDQDFAATAPNQKWRVDISNVWSRRWLYLEQAPNSPTRQRFP